MRDCKHGQLKHSCEICKLEARVKKLELQVEVLERKLKDKEAELELPF